MERVTRILLLFVLLLAACQPPPPPMSILAERNGDTSDISSAFTEDICVVNGEPRIYSISVQSYGGMHYWITYMRKNGDVVMVRVGWLGSDLSKAPPILITTEGACP